MTIKAFSNQSGQIPEYSNMLPQISYPGLSLDKSLRKESKIESTQTYSNENYRVQHGGCMIKWMNPKAGQRCASMGADRGTTTMDNGLDQIVQSGNYC